MQNRPSLAAGPVAAPNLVMVIDDNSLVRATVGRILTGAGYEVSEWADPRVALEHLEQATEAIALVLTDGVMPSMTGNVVAREVRRLRPDVPVMLMSGHEASLFNDVIGKPGFHFIAKPFVPADLVARVAAIIG